MGKASKWFRALLGLKTSDTNRSRAEKPPTKKKWGFVKEKDRQKSQHAVGEDGNEASKHAIAVAAATAAVAEAAVAAAQAAAAVVQLTSSGRNISMAIDSQSGAGYRSREEWAAVTIQSDFRAYLSRRALRALKALVKIQALVRGYLVRKQTAYALRRLQALVRAQVRARAGRVQMSEWQHSSMKLSHFDYLRNGSNSGSNGRVFEQGSFSRTLPLEDDRSDKILEVDTVNPHVTSKHRTLFYSSHLSLNSDQKCHSYSTSKESTAHQSAPSPTIGEAQSLSPLKFTQDEDENSPIYYSVLSRGDTSKRGVFTPTKSDGSRSCQSGYSDHPNYMGYTESSKAKVRSLSAPKQRPHQFERSSSTKRYSVYGDSRSTQFTNKAYPG